MPSESRSWAPKDLRVFSTEPHLAYHRTREVTVEKAERERFLKPDGTYGFATPPRIHGIEEPAPRLTDAGGLLEPDIRMDEIDMNDTYHPRKDRKPISVPFDFGYSVLSGKSPVRFTQWDPQDCVFSYSIDDGEPVTPRISRASRRPEVTFDPLKLEEGRHKLMVNATYGDYGATYVIFFTTARS